MYQKYNSRFNSNTRSKSSYNEIRPIENKNEPINNFNKNFYNPIITTTKEDAEKFYDENKINLKGKDIPLPCLDFKELNFSNEILNTFYRKKYKTPTPIQSQGWPLVLSGRDVVGIADTGSGKTISFVLPALIHASDQEPLRRGDGPIALILAPTRELVTQIFEVCQEYSKYYNLHCLAVYGGASIYPQKKALLKGVEILVATPGRLIDLHEQGFCNLNRVTFLVLDEADRMLDMGF